MKLVDNDKIILYCNKINIEYYNEKLQQFSDRNLKLIFYDNFILNSI
jgi:hypothetical protein